MLVNLCNSHLSCNGVITNGGKNPLNKFMFETLW